MQRLSHASMFHLQVISYIVVPWTKQYGYAYLFILFTLFSCHVSKQYWVVCHIICLVNMVTDWCLNMLPMYMFQMSHLRYQNEGFESTLPKIRIRTNYIFSCTLHILQICFRRKQIRRLITDTCTCLLRCHLFFKRSEVWSLLSLLINKSWCWSLKSESIRLFFNV